MPRLTCFSIDPQHQRLESADGTRWALGRNVKVYLADHRSEGIEVWQLRTRDEHGKVITVATHLDRDHAQAWVSPQGEEALRRWVRNGIQPYRHVKVSP